MTTQELLRYLGGVGVLAENQENVKKWHNDGEMVAIFPAGSAWGIGFKNGSRFGLTSQQRLNLTVQLDAAKIAYHTTMSEFDK